MATLMHFALGDEEPYAKRARAVLLRIGAPAGLTGLIGARDDDGNLLGGGARRHADDFEFPVQVWNGHIVTLGLGHTEGQGPQSPEAA